MSDLALVYPNCVSIPLATRTHYLVANAVLGISLITSRIILIIRTLVCTHPRPELYLFRSAYALIHGNTGQGIQLADDNRAILSSISSSLLHFVADV